MTTLKAHRVALRPNSFSLIELLVVIAIIGILASLILVAGNGVIIKAKRSRAATEIQAISTALEGYKTDNGIYALANGLTTNIYAGSDGTSLAYQTNSQSLYQALSGQTNFLDIHISSSKTYMAFKANQLGNTASPAGSSGTTTTYVQDPWGYSYGYSTGTNATAVPYNGAGFFDLWSTGGLINGAQANTAPWVSNWTQ